MIEIVVLTCNAVLKILGFSYKLLYVQWNCSIINNIECLNLKFLLYILFKILNFIYCK